MIQENTGHRTTHRNEGFRFTPLDTSSTNPEPARSPARPLARLTLGRCFFALMIWALAASPLYALSDEDPPWEEDLEAVRATIDGLLDEQSRIRISGTERVRIMNISSDSESSTGPYGEILERGNSIRYRLGLRVEATVTPSLTAGGWLRLSNEGRTILTEGPDYLSLERGSAFVRYNGESFNTAFGYYPIHFTALTLMRWDLEDNPQGGGSMACAVCGTAAGLLSAESLEELGPTLTFEGGWMGVSVGEFMDLTALYANPNRVSSSLYHRDLWGARSVFHLYGPRSSRGTMGMTYLRAVDDQESLEGELARFDPIETELVGFDSEIVPVGAITFTGEWVRTHALKAWGRRHGEAYIVGARLLYRRSYSASWHYIHIDPTFRSPYAALSYLSNRKGIRATAGWRSQGRGVILSFFYKRLEEMQPESPVLDPTEYTTWGIALRAGLFSHVSLEGSLILDLEKMPAPPGFPEFRKDLRKRTTVVDLIHEFGGRNTVRLRYQATAFEDNRFPMLDYLTHLTSILWAVEF